MECNDPAAQRCAVEITDSSEQNMDIIRAVADLQETEPENLDETLYDVIDGDALSNLFRGDGWGQLMFEFNGCMVTVDSNNDVSVEQIA